jgi:pimeloyl-ACP methyl ester carboxylesterase
MNTKSTSAAEPPAVAEGLFEIGEQRLFYRRLIPGGATTDPGPTLVFLHEALGCTAMWHDFPAQVVNDTGLPAIVYDRAGYGNSSRMPDHPRDKTYLHQEAEIVLPQLLAGLGIDRALLVGHSDGGSIALLAAAADPAGQVAGIITEAAHVFVESITRQGIREALASYETRGLEKRLARYHGDRTRGLFRAWADTWLSTAFRDWNIENCLGRIQCPTLVIQGIEDPYGSRRQVEAIVAGIGPRATALLIPGCGHIPHRDAPGRVRRAIADFAAAL